MKNEDHPFENSGMHKGASPRIFDNARKLRGRMTESEVLLWDKLKGNKLGCRFRRQHPVDIYITDFYCHKKKLVVELDGGYHENEKQKTLDKKRTKNLEYLGLTVIRFSNAEVFSSIEKVVKEIRFIMDSATPNP